MILVADFFIAIFSSIVSTRSISDVFMIADVPLVFYAIKGFLIPYSYFPRPEPNFQPCFSIIFKIFSSF